MCESKTARIKCDEAAAIRSWPVRGVGHAGLQQAVANPRGNYCWTDMHDRCERGVDTIGNENPAVVRKPAVVNTSLNKCLLKLLIAPTVVQ